MAKRGRPPGNFGKTYDTGQERSKFGKLLHEKFLDIKGRRIYQSQLAEAMGIAAPTLTSMLQFDEELVKGDRLYLLFKNLAQLLAQCQVTILEDHVRELLGEINRTYFSQAQKDALIKRL